MTAQVVAFREREAPADHEALLNALAELHALITIDPVLGASAVRVYFVLNPVAKAKIADCLEPGAGARPRPAAAYALVAYDFPYALHLIETSARQLSLERAKAIVTSSADLQGDSLRRAAAALGIQTQAIASFDEDALKAAFFPSTQESVTHVLQLEAPAAGRGAERP